MTKISVALSLMLVFMLTGCEKKTKDMEVRITAQHPGYGYQIINNNKIIINQPFIPAIQGEKTFTNEADAQKTAQLVLSKIHHYSLPGISVHELDSMNIRY